MTVAAFRETRRHQRFSVDIEAVVRAAQGDVLPARTRDVSMSGICLITGASLPRGEDLAVELVLAFGNSAYSEPLRLKARVVWCTSIAGAFQVGAVFEPLTEEQEAYLEMFLHFLDGTLAPKGGAEGDGQSDDEDPDPLSPDEKDDPFR